MHVDFVWRLFGVCLHTYGCVVCVHVLVVCAVACVVFDRGRYAFVCVCVCVCYSVCAISDLVYVCDSA